MARRTLFLLPLPLLLALTLGACGGGGDDTPIVFTVGGTASGLPGSGLVLRLNGGNDLAVPSDGAFVFPGSMADGASYDVTVASAPPGATCTVDMGSGTIAGANVSNVAVLCSVAGYTVGGTVSGLTGPGLVLRLNGANDLAVAADGPFAFPLELADGAGYAVTIASDPSGGICEVGSGSGVIAGADVDDVSVTCTGLFTVSGEVTGAAAGNVVLQLNGGDDVSVPIGMSFAFPTPLLDGTLYSVTVLSRPAELECEVSAGEGTLVGADATGVRVICRDIVTGLVATNGSNPSIYSRIDATDGTVEPISSSIGFARVSGLAYDSTRHRLFGSDATTNTLLEIDPLVGSAFTVGAVGSLGVDAVNGLAFDEVANVLYGISSPEGATSAQLVTIDRSTGVATPVGLGFPIGTTRCLGLAHDDSSDVLYASTADGRVIEINKSTGASRGQVMLPVVSPIEGLAYDAATDRLYGMLSKQRLIRIDPATGQAVYIGLVNGFYGIEGLAWAGELGALMGTSTRPIGESFLLEIQESNAVARTVGSTGYTITGLTNDPASGRVFGITSNSQLLLIDDNSAHTTYQGRVNTPNAQKTRSLVYNPGTATLFTYAIDPEQGGDDSLVEFNQFGFLIQNHGPTATMGGDFEALSMGPLGSTMYGILDRGLASPALLYQIEPNGAVALLHVLLAHDQLRSLAFDPLSAATNPTFYSVDNITDRLISIDLASGATIDLGPTTEARGMTWIPR